MLVHDLDVRVISKDREMLRHFTLDPSRDYLTHHSVEVGGIHQGP